MPDPFRHYEGIPLVDLPADPPSPRVSALEVMLGEPIAGGSASGPALLSQVLFYSAAISATKLVPHTGYRYALRVNPSSGNLHPTEFHFVARGLTEWPDGLYHYRPSSHMAEQRATGRIELGVYADYPLVFLLTSIVWREAWKYGERAYRYCLHDIGHAWQAVSLAARAIGCDSVATGDFSDDAVASACQLSDDEWPMLIIAVRGPCIALRQPDSGPVHWFDGQPNRLSRHPISYAAIDRIHDATRLRSNESLFPPRLARPGSVALPAAGSSIRPFGEVARTRRSALNFTGGSQSMTLAQLSSILAAASSAPRSWITLYLYVHRVDDLGPGVYRHSAGCGELEPIKTGDQSVAAAGLSLGQDLAGNACVAFSMVADVDRATRAHGDRGYRYVYFEAGAMGQRLYLAAEALGLGATGIGAFFDDRVHEYLELTPEDGQVIYHFAIGYPVIDPRLEA